MPAAAKNNLTRLPCLLGVLAMLAGSVSGCNLPASNPPTAAAAVVAPSPRPALPTARPSDTPYPTLVPSPLPAPTATPLAPVRIESLPINSHFLGNSRVLTVYLPPAYDSEPGRSFKVLYVNDGQDLTLVAFEQILYGYISLNQLEQIIVVGIPASADRENEYGTGTILDDSGQGIHAQQYEDFLIKEVIPLIHSTYRSLDGPQNTGLLGQSLGGLSAFYTAWTHPEVFGIVGAFSGSFWWRTNVSNLQALLDSRVAQKAVREGKTHPQLKMWFSAGTAEFDQDRDGNGVIDMVQDTTDLLAELSKKGYQNGIDYRYVKIEGGKHDWASWVKVLPDFLIWAFPGK
jgi:iron(III)-enterobactin esterase